MTYSINCPKCKSLLELDSKYINNKLVCPSCSYAFYYNKKENIIKTDNKQISNIDKELKINFIPTLLYIISALSGIFFCYTIIDIMDSTIVTQIDAYTKEMRISTFKLLLAYISFFNSLIFLVFGFLSKSILLYMKNVLICLSSKK